MSNFRDFEGMRLRGFGIARWKLWLVGAALVALAIAVITVATGIFLVAVPVLLLVGLAARLFAGGTLPRPPMRRPRPDGRGPLIEGDYTVVSSRPMPGSSRR
jgi:hypothetical protein